MQTPQIDAGQFRSFSLSTNNQRHSPALDNDKLSQLNIDHRSHIPQITIIGAGPIGSCTALFLNKLGASVEVKEKYSEEAIHNYVSSRSINITLNNRGLDALKLIGVHEHELLEKGVKLYGRVIHSKSGDSQIQQYGQSGQYILSIDREDLSRLLIKKVSDAEIPISFGSKLGDVDFNDMRIKLESENEEFSSIPFEFIIGADGIHSRVRDSINLEMGSSTNDLYDTHIGYKHFTLPPECYETLNIEKDLIHVWPREGSVLVAIPSGNESLSFALFMEKDSNIIGFRMISDNASINKFITSNYPELEPYIDRISQQLINYPIGNLSEVRSENWSYNKEGETKAILVGDAAHGMVPFDGQGTNSSLDDLREMFLLISQNGFPKVFDSYVQDRKEVSEMIQAHSKEKKDTFLSSSKDPVSKKTMDVFNELSRQYDDFESPYSVISFSSNTSYRDGLNKASRIEGAVRKFIESNQKERIKIDEVHSYLKDRSLLR